MWLFSCVLMCNNYLPSPALPYFHFRKGPSTKKNSLRIHTNVSFFRSIPCLPVLSDQSSSDSPNQTTSNLTLKIQNVDLYVQERIYVKPLGGEDKPMFF